MLKTTKQCTTCAEIKNISEFHKYRTTKDGLSPDCKKCKHKRVKIYQRTKKGVITAFYKNQKSSCIKRGHPLPSYTKQYLLDWLIDDWLFDMIYNNWKNCGYQKSMKPSIDRIDDYKSYTFYNIQLMTWGENWAKCNIDRINGKNNKQNKEVLQFSKDGKLICRYHSTREAERKTGVCNNSISCACKGTYFTAGGFLWEYVG